MCGIIGAFQPSEMDKEWVYSNLDKIKPRGPDADFVVNFPGLILGFSRLAIQDLSTEASQPFETSKYFLCLNGEIYNHLDLREEFKLKCNTMSDTETCIRLYEKIGNRMFDILEGMFVIVIFNKRAKTVLTATDYFGMKTLYYSRNRFCSRPDVFTNKLSPKGLSTVARYGYPFSSVYCLVLKHKRNTLMVNFRNPTRISKRIFYQRVPFKYLIEDSVRYHLLSDRPIGIALSGGVDSSLISLIASNYNHKIKAFFIDFNDDVARENIRAIQRHTKIHVLKIKAAPKERDFYDAIANIGQPMELGSTRYTEIIARAAKRAGLKVILMGDGADEIFGGYRRHQLPFGKKEYERLLRKSSFLELSRNGFITPGRIKISWTDNWMTETDIEYELQHYHNRRLDMIISEHGLEARFPYMSKAVYSNTLLNKQPSGKAAIREAIRSFCPDVFIQRIADTPKVPLKYKKDMKGEIFKAIDIFQEQLAKKEVFV